jgi:hypothetical protein
MEGNNLFIIFTDEFSHYGYIYLICERSEVLQNFKICKDEVKNQHNVKIKVVRSYKGENIMGDIFHMDKFPVLLQILARKWHSLNIHFFII